MERNPKIHIIESSFYHLVADRQQGRREASEVVADAND